MAPPLMADTRAQHLFSFFTQLSRVTNDIEDLLAVVEYGAKLGDKLTAEERKVLFRGYQKVIDAKMKRWRKISSIKNTGDVHFVRVAKIYLNRLESEIAEKCHEILAMINCYLLGNESKEAAVLFGKMKGDYYSDLAEVKTDADREEAVSQSLKAYEAATDIAQSNLMPTNPFRLCLVLSFSTFLHLIMDNTERACNMARQATTDADAELDSLDQKSRQDCSHILRKIKENLALWSRYPAEIEFLRPPPPPK